MTTLHLGQGWTVQPWPEASILGRYEYGLCMQASHFAAVASPHCRKGFMLCRWVERRCRFYYIPLN